MLNREKSLQNHCSLHITEEMSAPIKSDDSAIERVSKLLPADVTAAFLSVKEALSAYYNDPAERAAPVFWTFVAILLLSIAYFYFYNKITNIPHISFLCISYVVFALSLASTDFMNFFPAAASVIKITSIALPILWAFLISNIFLGIVGSKVESRTT